VCQQALLNRLEPIFEPVSMKQLRLPAGRSTKGCSAEDLEGLAEGNEWIVDADLRNFFGSADHAKLVTLVANELRRVGCCG